LDIELRPQGILLNAVAPQLLDTLPNRPRSAEVVTHAVATEAIVGLVTFPVSDAATPVAERSCRASR
jgi:hypothetical protein